MKLLVVCLFFTLALNLRAEDWTVKDKTYHDVTVGKVEADRVQIYYAGGVGTVALADLPADLQKRFNYDPVKAAEAVQKRLADEQAGEAARLAEAAQMQAQEKAFITQSTAVEQAAAAQAAANAQKQWQKKVQAWQEQVQGWPKHVRASEIEAICSRVRLDEQAHWADVQSVGTDFEANRKRKLENGLERLWTSSIPMASKLLERPCTPEQTDWLNRFIKCAQLSATKNAEYGALCTSLATRPADPVEPGPMPPAPLPPGNSAYAVNPSVASPPPSKAPAGSVTDPSRAVLERTVAAYTWTWTVTPSSNHDWDSVHFHADKTYSAWTHGKLRFTGEWGTVSPSQIQIQWKNDSILLTFDPTLSQFNATILKNGQKIEGARKDAVGAAADNQN